ncbi:MAG TPA: hypothetical protein VMF09_08330 [Solirubrobacteraceae bacterium]|nr:hypothetical protein [Solirubrobacteraceae bacterium]
MSLVRAARAFVWRRRRLRTALLTLAIALLALAGGWLWFRDSPFVSVQRVQIVGVSGADAQAVEAALKRAARGMSTLEVSDAQLRAAVAPLHLVRRLRAVASFPHGLRIEVVEQPPVAALTVGSERTAVAADGVVLGPALISGSLPSVSGSALPAPGRSVAGASLLARLIVLGAAPVPLLAHVERAFTGAEGLTLAMRNGLLVYFGDAARPHAKWLSLARVLADPSSAGASYIDVRLPSHPAAGFPAGVTPPDAAAGTSAAGAGEQAGGLESTISALAAALPGGSAATGADEPPSSGAAGSQTSSPEASAGAETGTSAGAETGTSADGSQTSPGGGAETPTSTEAATPTGAAAGAPAG